MTGIVNSTGARSGVIGTTVGTPVSADGTITKLEFLRTSNSSGQGSSITWSTVAGSSKAYTPATGATWVNYSCRIQIGNSDARGIIGIRVYHDSAILAYSRITLDSSAGVNSEFDSPTGWSNFDAMIPAWSGSKTTLLQIRHHSSGYEGELHKCVYGNDSDGTTMSASFYTPTEVTMYSV